MVAALALVQRVEEAIKERLGEKECISEFGEAIYPFLASCGIDAKSIMEVTGLFTHVIEMRNEFFPNATFCATETLERLQVLFYHWKNEVGDLTPDETVLHWLRRGFDRMGGDMDVLEGFSPLALQRRLKEEADERA